MSHGKIRSEKICLNCGTETPSRFCPSCGQENIEPKQSVWQLITHFFEDITHFDGKFFLTVKDLFTKPGFLSKEYMIGRRASYLHPIRMYIFTSAIFFLIFFSLYDVKHLTLGNHAGELAYQEDPEVKEIVRDARQKIDSVKKSKNSPAIINSIPNISDSVEKNKGVQFEVNKTKYETVGQYDSAQKKMDPSKRDGWLKRKIAIRTIELNKRFVNDKTQLFRDMIGSFMHTFPKMLFISLPVFALLLKLLYYRRKQFYYTDHGIFAIHLYIFTFLVLLAFLGVNELHTRTGWQLFGWILFALAIYPLIYYYKSMRRFYGQGRGKTLLKYSLLMLLSFFVQLIIFISFILFTVFEA